MYYKYSTLEKKWLHIFKMTFVIHFMPIFDFSQFVFTFFNLVCLLTFQQGLFCRLRCRVTFFKVSPLKLYEFPLHMFFLYYSKGVLEQTLNVYTKLSHVI
jgi:hypothetical protein